MSSLRRSLLVVVAICATACADDSPGRPAATATSTVATPSEEPPTADPVTESADEPPLDVLGEPTRFAPGGNGASSMAVDVNGRDCVLSETLFGSCRAGTGAGGQFVVTAESTTDAPTLWNVVVRCGLQPSRPGASASGAFTPVMADLGLAPYGDVIGVTLLSPDGPEAALVYQPEGAACPVVWGLGEVGSDSLFTGGIDALNGEENPLHFTDASGAAACAVADGQGGISTGTPDGPNCRT